MKPNNIRLISAGAGTGKTFRLTEELTALLTGNESRYHPSKIIATTFTRASAAELKNRIQEKILERGKIETASQLEQALIGTVNSISQQLLSLFSFETGLSPSLTVIDDNEKDLLFHESLSQSLNTSMLDEWEVLGQKFSLKDQDTRNVIKCISDNARNNAINKKQLEWSRDDSIRSLQKLLPEAGKDLEKTIMKLKKLIPALRQNISNITDATIDTKNSLESLETFYHKLQQEFMITWADWAACSKLVCGKKAREAKVFDEARELIAAHIRCPEFQDDLFNYIRLCFNAAIISMEHYARLKKERGLVDFVDQESLLLLALNDIKIQKRFQHRFKVLLVDEFQDTSPLQLSLFLKMSSLVEKVIWVGDSKQAIYGFRNSDAQLIDTVTATLGKPEATDILQTSYRSRPGLVELVNSVFLKAFKKNEAALVDEQIVLKAHRKENKQLQTAFQLWGFQWQASPGKRDSNEKYQSHLAKRVKEFLSKKCLLEDPHTKTTRQIKAGDICILCRTNAKCTGIANALREQGLQAVVSNPGLNLTAEWRLLKACLHLLVDETDSLSKFEIKFLIDATHDVPAMLEERLLFLNRAGNDYKIKNNWLGDYPLIQWIDENRGFLLSESISGIIQLIFAGLDFNSVVMGWGNGPQRHANLQQILSYSNEFEDYCLKLALLPNVHGFLYWFDDLAADEQDKRGLVTNEFSVNIATYHSAKGLEWPVVILCDLEDEREPDVFAVRINAKDKIDFKEPLKDRHLRYWPWPYTITPYGKKSGYQEFIDRCKSSDDYTSLGEKERTEALRLLYVGFTRARDYLIIPFKVKSEDCYLKAVVENGISSFIEFDKIETDKIILKNKIYNQPLRLWITDYDDHAEGIDSSTEIAEVYEKKQINKYPGYYITPSASKTVEEVSFKEGIAIHNAFTTGDFDGERSEVGTFVHKVFCAYDAAISELESKEMISRLGNCYGLNDLTLNAEILRVACEFYKWIESEFRPVKVFKELPLMMQRNGQLIDGIADLVIETDHEVILIDYKTFSGDSAEMQWKARTFSGQLKLYLDILQQGFPGKKVQGAIYFVMNGVVWMEEEGVEVAS